MGKGFKIFHYWGEQAKFAQYILEHTVDALLQCWNFTSLHASNGEKRKNLGRVPKFDENVTPGEPAGAGIPRFRHLCPLTATVFLMRCEGPGCSLL